MRKIRLAFASALVALLVLPSLVEAQVPSPTAGVGSAVSAFDGGDWVGLTMRLALVVAVIWAAIWGLRWYTRRVSGIGGTGRVLQVLETRALGPNRSLQLVRVGRRAVLVGVTPERINQLLEVDDPEEVERITQALETSRSSAPLEGVSRLAGTISRLAASRRVVSQRVVSQRGGRAAPEASFEAVIPSTSPVEPAPAADQLQAASAYRRARIAELQRAIEQARAGTSLERAR